MSDLLRIEAVGLEVNPQRSVRTVQRHMKAGFGPQPTWIEGNQFFTREEIAAYNQRLHARSINR